MARRHGLSPQQLFGWRRQLREAAGGLSQAEELRFVPAVVDAVAVDACGRSTTATHRDVQAEPDAGIIEVEIDGVTIRVGRGADAQTITAVLRALKASR